MPRYDIEFITRAQRAVAHGLADSETFFRLADNSKMSIEEIVQQLEDDIRNGGPIFGKFLRSMRGAAGQSVLAAERQGQIAGVMDSRAEFRRLTTIAALDDALENANPEALEQVELDAGAIPFTWVAELRNTCNRCLPLHGTTLPMDTWREKGLSPETIHSGWDSPCHCQLVQADLAGDREDLMAPLLRIKQKGPDGKKISKRTLRGVAQADIERALKARDKALETEEGRRTLARLGRSQEEGRR